MIGKFLKTFNLSLHGLIAYLPALIGGIVVFVVSIFIANFLSKVVGRYSLKRTKDTLVANFIGKIAWMILFILGTVLALGILGLGTISNKILAGAGITTFVVGFALKDIGENFLSGLILAFSRPYHVGSLIECEEVKGVVKDMTLRQTTVESDEGRIILVPNSMILKNPLARYKNQDSLSQDFSLSLEPGTAEKAMTLIRETVHSFDKVLKVPEKPVRVIVESMSGDKVKIKIAFWFDTEEFKGSFSETRSEIMLAVFNALKKEGYAFSG
jgi:small conductance mechanosensitive channel